MVEKMCKRPLSKKIVQLPVATNKVGPKETFRSHEAALSQKEGARCRHATCRAQRISCAPRHYSESFSRRRRKYFNPPAGCPKWRASPWEAVLTATSYKGHPGTFEQALERPIHVVWQHDTWFGDFGTMGALSPPHIGLKQPQITPGKPIYKAIYKGPYYNARGPPCTTSKPERKRLTPCRMNPLRFAGSLGGFNLGFCSEQRKTNIFGECGFQLCPS